MATAVTLLGFILRAARLDYQSLWYDEGSSLYLSRQSLGAITHGTAADIHPPLYYYFLHFWMLAGGSSEYAVRSLSVAAGLLIVALLFALGRRLFTIRAGLVAALAGAVSPLLVYYSQEARMYAQVTMFGLLSTYLLVRACERPRPRAVLLWLAYAVATILCLYSQYIGALILAFQGIYVLLARRRSLLPFVAGAAAAVLVFAPWLAIAKGSLLGWPSTDAFHAGPGLFADAAFRYVEGLSANVTPLTIAFTLALTIIALFGLAMQARPLQLPSLAVRQAGRHGAQLAMHARPFRLPSLPAALRKHAVLTGASRARRNIWLPLLYLGVPLVAMFLLGYRKPIYNAKFALLALPAFLLLVAAGIDALSSIRAAGLVLLLVASGYALNNYYANPAFARDDYRGLAHFIATSARPGDAIILNAPGQEQIFPYYYHGSLPLIGLPTGRPLSQPATDRQLSDLSKQYQRLWLVLYGTNGSDPGGYVEHWLASHDFEVQDQWFGNVRLAAFAAPSRQPAVSHPANATLGGFAHLAGYTVTPPTVASGDVLQLGLRWQALGSTATNDKVFTHIIDAAGDIWAQRDSDPQGGARPTSTWKPGETIDDNYGLLVLPGTPPGLYQAEIGMYDPASGKRLPVTANGSTSSAPVGSASSAPAAAPGQADRILLAGVRVGAPAQPPSIDELRIPHALDHQLGSIRLLGYGLTLVGQEAERTTFAAGDHLQLTLFWQGDQPIGVKDQLTVELQPAGSGKPGRLLTSGTLLPQHPTTTWETGDRYRDQHRLVLPSGVTGDFHIVLHVNGKDATKLADIHLR